MRLVAAFLLWLCFSFLSLSVSLAQVDSRIPDEVRYKSGYVNPIPKPSDFTSVMLWGIAIADTRVHGHEKAQIEIAHTTLSCRVDGRDVTLNDDRGDVRGGLYRRHPWFGSDAHDPMPLARSKDHGVILRVGTRPERVWHFWAVSPRAALPSGRLEGCTVKARVRISRGALLQMGMDYWRNPTIGFVGSGGNNHESGASHWYFPSHDWQEAIFTDIQP